MISEGGDELQGIEERSEKHKSPDSSNSLDLVAAFSAVERCMATQMLSE